MAKSQYKVLDVIFDSEAACLLGMFWCIVPFNVYSSKFSACPIFCDIVVLFEDIAQVMDILFTNVYNTEIVQY